MLLKAFFFNAGGGVTDIGRKCLNDFDVDQPVQIRIAMQKKSCGHLRQRNRGHVQWVDETGIARADLKHRLFRFDHPEKFSGATEGKMHML